MRGLPELGSGAVAAAGAVADTDAVADPSELVMVSRKRTALRAAASDDSSGEGGRWTRRLSGLQRLWPGTAVA